jgi:AcrR family transcriptional regulator
VEETRRRIVEATYQLHGERGISDTSMVDVARRADVSIGTVYRHFSTLDDLVYACGQVVMEEMRPPTPQSIEAAGDTQERVRALVREVFAMYERGGQRMRLAMADVHRLKAVAEWFRRWEEYKESLVGVALGRRGEDREASALLMAMTGAGAWESLVNKGLSGDEAADLVSRAFLAWLESPSQRASKDGRASKSRRRASAVR